MAQSLSKVLVHLVFSTKRRTPLLPQTPYADLHAYAHGIFKKQKCHLIEMNNVWADLPGTFGAKNGRGPERTPAARSSVANVPNPSLQSDRRPAACQSTRAGATRRP